MPFRWILTAALPAFYLVACRGSAGKPAELPSSAQSVPAMSLLRLPRAGGKPVLYRVPDGSGSEWQAIDKLPPIRLGLGADVDQRMVYLTDTSGNVVVLDLQSRRSRTMFKGIAEAVVGPGGSLFAADSARRVTSVVRRRMANFRTPLPGMPRTMFGTQGAQLAAVIDRPTRLVMLGSDEAPVSVPLPAGPVSATAVGDLFAIATDTGVVFYEPGQKAPFASVDVGEQVTAVAFSPSGHRIYVAREDDRIDVLDRFSADRLDKIELPGRPVALRADTFGGWLLAQGEADDSVWVIDLARNEVVGALRTTWEPDLPVVVGRETLVARRGGNVMLLDLSRPGFPQRGAVAGGAEDVWLPVLWVPAGTLPPSRQPVDTSVVAVADSARPDSLTTDSIGTDAGVEPSGGRIYLQVSSSQNPSWAAELAEQLRAAGHPARVLPPTGADDSYRVVLGPYPSRDEAETAGRALGRPYFIYQPREDAEQ